MENQPKILNWASPDGSFKRQQSQFREWIGNDGRFPAEKDRYILYVSFACPWVTYIFTKFVIYIKAHRTLIVRSLKGLQKVIDVAVVHYLLTENGTLIKSFIFRLAF